MEVLGPFSGTFGAKTTDMIGRSSQILSVMQIARRALRTSIPTPKTTKRRPSRLRPAITLEVLYFSPGRVRAGPRGWQSLYH